MAINIKKTVQYSPTPTPPVGDETLLNTPMSPIPTSSTSPQSANALQSSDSLQPSNVSESPENSPTFLNSEMPAVPSTDSTSATIDYTDPKLQASIDNEVDTELKYGNRPLSAAALGAARGLSFGISDQALTKLGIMDPQEINEIKERNKVASVLGELGSFVAAPGLGAAGKAVTGVAKLSESLGEKLLGKVIAESANKSIAKQILAHGAKSMLTGATEGSVIGLGQLASEEALGNADLNAESLMAYGGTGALLGGVASGLFSAGKATVPLIKAGASKITSKFGKFTNASDAAMELIGMSPSKRIKVKNYDPEFAEELPSWLSKKADLKALTSDSTIEDMVLKVKEQAKKDINNVVKEIDSVSSNYPDILPQKSQVYGRVTRELDNIISKYDDVSGYSEQLRPVKTLRDEYKLKMESKDPIKASEIQDIRRKTDELINYDKTPGTYTLRDEALKGVRSVLSNEVKSIAASASLRDAQYGNMYERLLEYNKDFNYADKVLPSIRLKNEKASAIKDIFDFKDAALGTAAHFAGLSTPITGAIYATKKLIESDLRRKLVILSSLKKSADHVNSTISSSIADFFKNNTVKGSSSATKALLNTSLAQPLDKPTKPKDRIEAFKNIQNNISQLTTNPQKLQDLLAFRTMKVSTVAPTISSSATQTALRGLDFLSSKIPKPQNDLNSGFAKREFVPSSLELSKFERYVHTVESPLEAIKDLKSGQLTRESAEALQAVYPQLYIEIQRQALEFVNSSPSLSYDKRLQLGILLNIPADKSLEPANIAGLQASFTAQTEPPKPQLSGTNVNSIDQADRYETKQNKISQR